MVLRKKIMIFGSTWDDPVIIGGGYIGNSSKYRYFLKGKEDMEKDHDPGTQS